MSADARTVTEATETRARQSRGTSSAAIYSMAAGALQRRNARGRVLIDLGCGQGQLYEYVRGSFDRYIGVDAVRYDDFPDRAEFEPLDLDTGRVPFPDGIADVAVAVETIEHVENPRALVRELVRLTRPGGWVVVTTPNQRSLLSLLTLAIKGQFSAFQDVHYPAHLTALLDVDLRRMARECALDDVSIEYSGEGRIAFTPNHYPTMLGRRSPRLFSDNLLLIGRRGDR